MSIKLEILTLLEQSNHSILSGQEIAQKLMVSRAAVWKAINALRNDGYVIHATTNKGYALDRGNNLISEQGIKAYLCKQNQNLTIKTYSTLASTNSEAKKLTIDGAESGTVIVSDAQTAGRGRGGNAFFSPSKTGVYMSMIVKPDMTIGNVQIITIYTAVAVCKAIEKLTANAPKIKWVNDIFLNNLKICGILTEATGDFESGRIDSIIIGIGLNVNTEMQCFPLELAGIAGSLFPENISRNQLIAAIIDELLINQKEISQADLINEYKKRSFVIGEEISYQRDNIVRFAQAVDINQNGNLLVKTKENVLETLFFGEISIRRSQNATEQN